MTVKQYIEKSYRPQDAREIFEEMEHLEIIDKDVLLLTLSELISLAAELEMHITELVSDLAN